jgi:hypothetical protein
MPASPGIAALEQALHATQDPLQRQRCASLLAKLHTEAGDREAAIGAHVLRATLGGDPQEVFVSLYRVARLKQELGHDDDAVIAAYERATDACPARAEAIHAASRLCRERGRYQEGYRIGLRGLGIAPPPSGPGIEHWVYDYGVRDEFAVNAYWAGHYRESLDACLAILERGDLPESLRTRVAANARFPAARLAESGAGIAPSRDPAATHALGSPRDPHSRLQDAPRILLAILAKQKEAVLPLYLQCIEALDYPKSSICVHVRTNNNTDRTAEILGDWVERVRPLYARVAIDASDVSEPVQAYGVHEWNPVRFRVLGHIRNESLQAALANDCAFYFVADVDNFLRPCTLRELVALDLPIVAPLLRHVDPQQPYSNFHADIDANGYFRDSETFLPLVHRQISGICEVPVVHCTYLIRSDVIPRLGYRDATDRHEYVVFSDRARRAGIPQYLDTRQNYGYLTLDETVNAARALLQTEIGG